MNYANLSEGFIELPVARRRASGPGQFLGPMVMNFGGPAFPSGSALAGAGDENFTAEMLELYDLVAIDARGTTNNIICFDSSQLAEYWETNHFTRSTAELNHILDLERAANQRCLQHDPSIVRHMSTAESIRDLESLRLALGVNQFTFSAFRTARSSATATRPCIPAVSGPWCSMLWWITASPIRRSPPTS